jgi:hypothetical protein
MRTNKEKWEYFMNILNKKADEFMDSINPIIPKMFYKVNQNGTINTCNIIRRFYLFGIYLKGNKVTNDDINKISEFSNSNINFTVDRIYFEYYYIRHYNNKENKISSAYSLNDLNNKKSIFLVEDLAKKKAFEIIELNNENEEFYVKHKKDSNYNYSGNEYKFLGWQNNWEHNYLDEDGNLCSESGKPQISFGYLESKYPEYGNCMKLKHKKIEVQHNNRGSENTVSCPICKIYWKYDSSD